MHTRIMRRDDTGLCSTIGELVIVCQTERSEHAAHSAKLRIDGVQFGLLEVHLPHAKMEGTRADKTVVAAAQPYK